MMVPPPPLPPHPSGSAIALTAISTDGGPVAYQDVGPRLTIDDAPPVDLVWGDNTVPVAPGRHRLKIEVPYPTVPWFGRASTEVDVAAGEVVPLEYKTPVFTLFRGALGPPPQRARGGRLLLGCFSVLMIPMLILLVITLIRNYVLDL